MVVRERTNWVRMLFIWKGSILRKVIPQLSIITFFACLVFYFKGTIYDHKVHLNPAIFTLIGLALAIFMGFCNNASYERFWEGRKLWGTFVIEARSLTRQVMTLLPDSKEEQKGSKEEFVKMIAALAWSLNDQLRGKDPLPNLRRLLMEDSFKRVEKRHFKPVAVLDLMGEWVKKQYQTGKIDSILFTTFDHQLSQLSTIIGGCERISNTPLPFTYKVLLHRTVYMYCFWLPFGLVDVVGWMMPIIVLLISYTFIALDAVIHEIGDPFGEEENDLALDSICQTIEYSIFEQIGISQPPLQKRTEEIYVLR